MGMILFVIAILVLCVLFFKSIFHRITSMAMMVVVVVLLVVLLGGTGVTFLSDTFKGGTPGTPQAPAGGGVILGTRPSDGGENQPQSAGDSPAVGVPDGGAVNVLDVARAAVAKMAEYDGRLQQFRQQYLLQEMPPSELAVEKAFATATAFVAELNNHYTQGVNACNEIGQEQQIIALVQRPRVSLKRIVFGKSEAFGTMKGSDELTDQRMVGLMSEMDRFPTSKLFSGDASPISRNILAYRDELRADLQARIELAGNPTGNQIDWNNVPAGMRPESNEQAQDREANNQ